MKRERDSVNVREWTSEGNSMAEANRRRVEDRLREEQAEDRRAFRWYLAMMAGVWTVFFPLIVWLADRLA
jgi:hypothetical protein